MRLKNRRLLLTSSAVLPLVVMAHSAAHAQNSLSDVTTAPVAGAHDVYDLNVSASTDNAHDFTDTTPGQTFTAGGSSLYSITVKGIGNAGYSNNGNPNVGNWEMRLSSVNGTTLTPLTGYADVTAAATQVTNSSGYVTFSFGTPVAMTQGALYAFDLFSDNGYFGLARDLAGSGAFYTAGGRSFASTTLTPETVGVAPVSRTFLANFTSPTSLVGGGATITPGAKDIAVTDSSGTTSGSTDFTDNPTPGQIFTTGSNAQGYLLNSLSLKGANNTGGTLGNFNFRISSASVAGTAVTLTTIGTYSIPSTNITNAGNFFTFNLGNALQLNPNTQYAFDYYTDGGYFGTTEGSAAAAAALPGGYFNETTARTFGATGTITAGKVRTFDLGLTSIGGAAAPEPSSLALLGGVGGTFVLAMVRRRRAG